MVTYFAELMPSIATLQVQVSNTSEKA